MMPASEHLVSWRSINHWRRQLDAHTINDIDVSEHRVSRNKWLLTLRGVHLIFINHCGRERAREREKKREREKERKREREKEREREEEKERKRESERKREKEKDCDGERRSE